MNRESGGDIEDGGGRGQDSLANERTKARFGHQVHRTIEEFGKGIFQRLSRRCIPS